VSSTDSYSYTARLRTVLGGLRGGGRGWTLLAIAGGWFFVLGLRFVVPALLPAIREDFVVSDTAAGAAITLLWVTYAAMQFPAGALVDRAGERTLLATSAVAGAVTMGVYALSPTFAVFLVATGAYGLASGLYGPPRGTALTRIYTEQDGAAFGTVLAAGSVGAALLPAAATYATGMVGWRGALGLTAPAFLVAGLALYWTVPEQSAAATVEAGETAAPGDENPETDTDADTRTDGGAASLRARTAAVRRAVSSRKVALAVLGATLMLFVFQGLTAFFTTYLVTAKGLTEATAGLLFGVLFLSGAVFQSVGGVLADRYGHGRVLAVVAFVGVLPLVALPYTGGTLGLGLVAAFLGMRLSVGPISNAYIVSLLPPGVRGTAWGAVRTAFFMVGAFGSTAVGAMADYDLFTEAFLLLAALTALAGVIYLFLPARNLGTEGPGAGPEAEAAEPVD
jgi:predicted MFS family arabinose efflux permease